MIQRFKNILLIIFTLLFSSAAFGQEQVVQVSSPYDNLRYALIGFAIFLAIIIGVMGKAIMAVLKFKQSRKSKSGNSGHLGKTVLMLMPITLLTTLAQAQESTENVIKEKSWFVTVPPDIMVLTLIIVFEMILIFILGKIQMSIIKEEQPPKAVDKISEAKKWDRFFAKINNTVEIEDEESLDLNHEYDGIRELDNKIPKWWLYSFYITIFIGVIYMYRMFVSETMPDQITELHEANRIADIKMKEYLKDAANNVDENTVVMLDESGIASGLKVYNALGCSTCHGASGEGNSIGPNLTDDYWLHKGSINDIFYSIKYGWPEKGMKAWKDDMSPIQIAQVSSYIKSLKGSNPINAKEPQGELYKENESSEPIDSLSVSLN